MRYQELAKQKNHLEGLFSLDDLPRLKEVLKAQGMSDRQLLDDASVSFILKALPPQYFGEILLPMISLKVAAQLPMVCQRCFANIPQNIVLEYAFALSDEPPESLLEDEVLDWLAPDEEVSTSVLVEDELLMALPIAVMHEEVCSDLQVTADEKPNPFAVLQQLKQQK